MLIRPIEFFVPIPHRIMRYSVILTNFKEFFFGVRIVSSVKTSFMQQWNLQSFQDSPHVIIHVKLIHSPNHRMLGIIQMLRTDPVSTHGRQSWGGWGAIAPSFCQIFENLPLLPQILAFLCLQPPHVPVSPSF